MDNGAGDVSGQREPTGRQTTEKVRENTQHEEKDTLSPTDMNPRSLSPRLLRRRSTQRPAHHRRTRRRVAQARRPCSSTRCLSPRFDSAESSVAPLPRVAPPQAPKQWPAGGAGSFQAWFPGISFNTSCAARCGQRCSCCRCHGRRSPPSWLRCCFSAPSPSSTTPPTALSGCPTLATTSFWRSPASLSSCRDTANGSCTCGTTRIPSRPVTWRVKVPCSRCGGRR